MAPPVSPQEDHRGRGVPRQVSEYLVHDLELLTLNNDECEERKRKCNNLECSKHHRSPRKRQSGGSADRRLQIVGSSFVGCFTEPLKFGLIMRKGNSSNFKLRWDRGVSVPGAFKLDHLQPFKPILF